MTNCVDLGDNLDQVKEEVSCLSARAEQGGPDARKVRAERASGEQDRYGFGRVCLGHDDVDDAVDVKGLDVAHVFGTEMLVQDMDARWIHLPAQRQNGRNS